MKLACSSRIAPGSTYREKVASLERFGFAGIEARLPEDEATPERVEEVEEALAHSSVRACSLIVPGPVYVAPLDSEDAKQRKLEKGKSALRIGARLGAPVFIAPEYRPQSPLPLFDPPRSLDARERELFFSFLRDIAECAEKVAAVALLEPINRYETHYYHRLEEAVAVCQQIGSPRVKVVADFFHMNIEEADIPASIARAAGYIGHVQLADSNRLLPGQGHTDFTAGFTALRQIGYDGYMALECRIPAQPERELPECVRYLRQCLGESLG
ncbi:MAG TPA: sugar phosphate isomerase/epimerase family protein [archaeon]|nr:sugar phosphate isomerase/epimerase family protein [archaeon]